MVHSLKTKWNKEVFKLIRNCITNIQNEPDRRLVFRALGLFTGGLEEELCKSLKSFLLFSRNEWCLTVWSVPVSKPFCLDRSWTVWCCHLLLSCGNLCMQIQLCSYHWLASLLSYLCYSEVTSQNKLYFLIVYVWLYLLILLTHFIHF